MTREQGKVKEFMQTFGQATPDKPTVPDAKTRELRVKLLLEEVLELAEASGVQVITEHGQLIESTSDLSISVNPALTPNLVGVADALADIDYVMQGAAVAYGLDLEPFCDEVHRSNMTKLWKLDEVSGTPALNITRVQDKGDGRVCLVKNESGKVLKSPSYSAANLAPIVEEQKNWLTVRA